MRLFGMKLNDHGVELIKELPPFLLPLFDIYDYVEFYSDDKRSAIVEGTIISSLVEKTVNNETKPIFILTYVIVDSNQIEHVVNEDLIINLIGAI